MRITRFPVFLLTLALSAMPVVKMQAQCNNISGGENIENGPDNDWFDDWEVGNGDSWGDDNNWWGGRGNDGNEDDSNWWNDWWKDGDADNGWGAGDEEGANEWGNGESGGWWGLEDDDGSGGENDGEDPEDGEEQPSLEERAKRADEEAERAKAELANRNEDLNEAEKDLLSKKRFLDEWSRLLGDGEFDDRPKEERQAITDNVLRLQEELEGRRAQLMLAQGKQARAADAERRASEANANLQRILADKKEAERQAAITAAREAEQQARREAEANRRAALEREARRQRQEAERLRWQAEQARRREQREREKAEMARKLEEEYGRDSGTTTREEKPDEAIPGMDIGMDQPTSWFGAVDRDATAEEVHQKVMQNLTRFSGSDASGSQNLAISQADKFQQGEYGKANLRDIAAGVVTSTLNCGLSKMTGPVGSKLKNAIEGVMETYDEASGYYENAQEVYDSIAHSLRDHGMQVHQDTFQGLNYTLTTTTVFDPTTHEYTTHVARTPTGTQGTMSRALRDCSTEEITRAMSSFTSSAVLSGKINYE